MVENLSNDDARKVGRHTICLLIFIMSITLHYSKYILSIIYAVFQLYLEFVSYRSTYQGSSLRILSIIKSFLSGLVKLRQGRDALHLS